MAGPNLPAQISCSSDFSALMPDWPAMPLKIFFKRNSGPAILAMISQINHQEQQAIDTLLGQLQACPGENEK
ncbi:MAG: hypothetical protein H7222_04090 [Methylotenera sp.]|nr:hypothetical protein [Oligoflexia bacterium]